MKKGIHPEYNKVVFMDTTSGYKFICGSTKTSNETIEMEDGNTYPLIKIKIQYGLVKSRAICFFCCKKSWALGDFSTIACLQKIVFMKETL